MNTKKRPFVPEFESEAQAAKYDQWFRWKVQNSLKKPRPGVAHDEVMTLVDKLVAAAERRTDQA